MSAGLLIARLLLGLGIAAHGSQKLFGWFGGHGPQGTGAFFHGLGFRPGTMMAVAAGLCEFLGGLLLTAGFLGGAGPGLVVLVMLVAIFAVHVANGFFTQNNGWEMPALYIAGALALDFGGYGDYSLDRAFNLQLLATVHVRWILLAAAIVLAAINLAMRSSARRQSGQSQTA